MRSARALGWLWVLAAAGQLALADQPLQSAPPTQPQPQQLQLHLSNIQAQAQRQLSQLVAGTQLANLTQANAKQAASSVLEALGSVGKAIQAQVRAPGSLLGAEHRPLPAPDGAGAQAQLSSATSAANKTNPSYREQGEQLREEIVRRAGQLQQVVGSSLELLKSNGDLIVRRLLEQLNARLDVAKSKADRIINEPTTNEVGLRALATVNQGLNNLNTIIANIVAKLDLNLNGAQPPAQPANQRALAALEAPKYRLTLHQLGQQLSSAVSAAQRQQQQLQQPQVDRPAPV